MKKLILQTTIEFANHITEKDVSSTLEKIKSDISKINIYPLGKITEVVNTDYKAYLKTKGDREVIFDFINEEGSESKVEFSRSATIKETKDGEIKLLAEPSIMGVDIYEEGGTSLSKAWNEISIKSVRKTNRVRGILQAKSDLTLFQVIVVSYVPKKPINQTLERGGNI